MSFPMTRRSFDVHMTDGRIVNVRMDQLVDAIPTDVFMSMLAEYRSYFRGEDFQ